MNILNSGIVIMQVGNVGRIREMVFVPTLKVVGCLTKLKHVRAILTPMRFPKSGKIKNKAMRTTILTFLMLAQTACNSSTNAPKGIGESDRTLPAGHFEGVRCWVNSEYQACVLKKLPCDCMDIDEPHMIYLDPENNNVETFGIETDAYYLKPSEPFNFAAYSSEHSLEPSFDMRISRDTLVVKGDHFTRAPFLPLDKALGLENENDKLSRYNYMIIKKRIEEKGSKFFELTQLDTTRCEFTCNRDLGFLNLLYLPGDCSKDMFVVNHSNGMVFYHLLNGCQDKTAEFVPDKLKAFSINQ